MPQLHRRALLAAVAALVLSGAPPARADDIHITIDNFTFSPAEITIPAGSKVTWTNHDDIPHTVTDAGTPRAFKSPPLDTGDSFSQVFATPGTYSYFCSLHPHMQGKLVIR